ARGDARTGPRHGLSPHRLSPAPAQSLRPGRSADARRAPTRSRGPSRSQGPHPRSYAVAAGFEPAVAMNHTSFRVKHLRPLGHATVADPNQPPPPAPNLRGPGASHVRPTPSDPTPAARHRRACVDGSVVHEARDARGRRGGAGPGDGAGSARATRGGMGVSRDRVVGAIGSFPRSVGAPSEGGGSWSRTIP